MPNNTDLRFRARRQMFTLLWDEPTLNLTQLTEACANSIPELSSAPDDPDHWLWDLAIEVSEKYEAHTLSWR